MRSRFLERHFPLLLGTRSGGSIIGDKTRLPSTVFSCTLYAPDGRLIGVAPLFIREYRLLRFVRFRFAQFFGADSSITELRGLVCAPDDQPAAVAALAAFFQGQYRFWDLLRWDGLRASPNGERVHGLGEACDAGGQLPNYFIPLPSTWDEMLSRLNGKFKRNIRKRYELLAKDGFAFKFRVNENADAVRGSLRTFFDLHGLRGVMTMLTDEILKVEYRIEDGGREPLVRE